MDPIIFYHTLQEFIDKYDTILQLFLKKNLEFDEKYSGTFFDLTIKEKAIIKDFFDDNEGFNKILFAKKYIELAGKPFFKEQKELEWIEEVKMKLYK